MSQVNVLTIPENKESKDISEKIKALVEDRNKAIARYFKTDEKDIIVKLYRSSGALRSKIDFNGDGMGVFSGYVDGSDEIMLIHPENVDGLFTDLWKEMGVLVDYTLTKFYLCKKYFPNREDYKLYYKYLSEVLAQTVSGKLQEGIVNFDMKTYFEGKKYKKDQEIAIVLYYMRENSGLDFIFEHLDTIMKDCDIKKSLFTIYKKTLSEIIMPQKTKLVEEERKLQRVFKPGRGSGYRPRR